MTSKLGDRILLWLYSDTGMCTFESCEWYSPDSFGLLHFSASQFIRNQLHEFHAEFSEWFNLADFPDVGEQLEPAEVPVFLKAAGAPDDWTPDPDDASSMGDYDSFSGLRAVIRHRLDQRSLEQIKRAAELFNWTIDFGLDCSGTNAHAVLRVGSVEDVAPTLLKRILNRLAHDAKRDPANQTWPSGVARFLPLAPVLTMLKETVQSTDWVQNQLALRIFFWIAEMYKVELENEAG